MSKNQFNAEQNIKMATTRSDVYNMLAGFVVHIPNDAFLDRIKSKEYQDSLYALKALKDKKITKGADLLLAYIKKVKEGSEEEILEAIAVDRTRIIRIPNMVGLRAPYESQYVKKKSANAIMLDLKKFYQEAGFAPPNCDDSLDFLGVELDFLNLLNRKIIATPSDAGKYLNLQKRFITEHLGKWIDDYTQSAEEHTETDFYKGWLHLISGFIQLDREYLDQMTK